jgi:hypothetical protein
MPPDSDLNMSFIRDVFSGAKRVTNSIHSPQEFMSFKLIKMHELRVTFVPQYKEFAVTKVWETLRNDPLLEMHMPNYSKGVFPNREFLYNVSLSASTLLS